MKDIRRFNLNVNTYDYGRGDGFDESTGIKVTNCSKEGISADECRELIRALFPFHYNDDTDEGIRNMYELNRALIHCMEYNGKLKADAMLH